VGSVYTSVLVTVELGTASVQVRVEQPVIAAAIAPPFRAQASEVRMTHMMRRASAIAVPAAALGEKA
jgi:hypothetical protein